MTQNWLAYKKSTHLLDSSLVANDAYVALNFLNEKNLELEPTRKIMYLENAKRGLELLKKIRFHITRTENEFEKEEFYSLIKKLSNDLLKKPNDLVIMFDGAIEEITAISKSRHVHLEDSLTLLSSISKTTSSELNSQYRYIR